MVLIWTNQHHFLESERFRFELGRQFICPIVVMICGSAFGYKDLSVFNRLLLNFGMVSHFNRRKNSLKLDGTTRTKGSLMF